jgi:hypothetical protein
MGSATAPTPDRQQRPGDPVIRNADSPHAIPGEFLVALRGDVPWSEVRAVSEAVVARHGGAILTVLESLPGFGLAATDEQARTFAADPAVDVVEQNLRGQLRDTTGQSHEPTSVPREDQP